MWCNLALLYPPKANVSSSSSYVKHFIAVNMNGINFDNGLQNQDIPKLKIIRNWKLKIEKFITTRLWDSWGRIGTTQMP